MLARDGCLHKDGCGVGLLGVSPSPEVTTGEGQVTLHTGGACSALRRIDVAVLLEGIGRKDGMGRIDDCQRALGEGGLALIIVAFVGLEA